MARKNLFLSNILKQDENAYICIKQCGPILPYPYNLSKVNAIYIKGNKFFRDIDLSPEELRKIDPAEIIICPDLSQMLLQILPEVMLDNNNNNNNNFGKGVKRSHDEENEPNRKKFFGN